MKTKTKSRTVRRQTKVRRTIKPARVAKHTVVDDGARHESGTMRTSIARAVNLPEPRIYRVHLEGNRHIVITVKDGVAIIDSNFKRVVGATQQCTESDAKFNLAVDGLETMVCQAAVAGVDTDSPEFVHAISSALGELGKKYT